MYVLIKTKKGTMMRKLFISVLLLCAIHPAQGGGGKKLIKSIKSKSLGSREDHSAYDDKENIKVTKAKRCKANTSKRLFAPIKEINNSQSKKEVCLMPVRRAKADLFPLDSEMSSGSSLNKKDLKINPKKLRLLDDLKNLGDSLVLIVSNLWENYWQSQSAIEDEFFALLSCPPEVSEYKKIYLQSIGFCPENLRGSGYRLRSRRVLCDKLEKNIATQLDQCKIILTKPVERWPIDKKMSLYNNDKTFSHKETLLTMANLLLFQAKFVLGNKETPELHNCFCAFLTQSSRYLDCLSSFNFIDSSIVRLFQNLCIVSFHNIQQQGEYVFDFALSLYVNNLYNEFKKRGSLSRGDRKTDLLEVSIIDDNGQVSYSDLYLTDAEIKQKMALQDVMTLRYKASQLSVNILNRYAKYQSQQKNSLSNLSDKSAVFDDGSQNIMLPSLEFEANVDDMHLIMILHELFLNMLAIKKL
jgi:hypothetical protein